jgi:hypothetical protein
VTESDFPSAAGIRRILYIPGLALRRVVRWPEDPGQEGISGLLRIARPFRQALATGISLLVVGAVLRFTPPFYSGDAESARYYLNTIATSLSTILALSISIIMVAIQLTASKYTHRVFDFFLRFPLNVPLLVSFLATILDSTFTLSRLNAGGRGNITVLAQDLSADFVMMIVCFLMLLLYVNGMVQLLKPEQIVNRIRSEFQNDLKRSRYHSSLAKVEQICDIAKKAATEMDSSTGSYCVLQISEMIRLASRRFDEDKKTGPVTDVMVRYHTEYQREMIARLVAVATISLKERESTISRQVLQQLYERGLQYLEAGRFQGAEYICRAFLQLTLGNLVGQRQAHMLELVIHCLNRLVTRATEEIQGDNAALQHERSRFILHVFDVLQQIGAQVMESEPNGYAFVAKHVVTHTYGTVLTKVIQGEGGRFVAGTARALIHEYMKLAKLLVLRAEPKDILLITTWLRHDMLPQREYPERARQYLYLFLLLVSVTLYHDRHDLVTLLIRAVGKYFPPDRELANRMAERRLEIRAFYDYHEPERYLSEAYVLWDGYHRYARLYPDGPQRPVGISGEWLRDRETWRDLFDGFDPEAFLRPARE